MYQLCLNIGLFGNDYSSTRSSFWIFCLYSGAYIVVEKKYKHVHCMLALAVFVLIAYLPLIFRAVDYKLVISLNRAKF